jgi:hypothetical protein
MNASEVRTTDRRGSMTRTEARDRWTAARWFLAVMAPSHLALGIAGLVANRSFPIGARAAEEAGSAHIFGVFDTNGWHSAAAILIGVLALYFTIDPRRARTVALAIGVTHVGIVVSLLITEPSTFWMASNTADQGVHLFSAIGGIAAGLMTPANPHAVAVPRD